MFFKRKEKVEGNADHSVGHSYDEKIVYGVNHKDAFVALAEQDVRFNKGCFSYKPSAGLYMSDRIMINETYVLTNKHNGIDRFVLRYTDEGLKFKDEILAALQKLVREHQIFVENRDKETLEGLKNSLNDYISR